MPGQAAPCSALTPCPSRNRTGMQPFGLPSPSLAAPRRALPSRATARPARAMPCVVSGDLNPGVCQYTYRSHALPSPARPSRAEPYRAARARGGSRTHPTTIRATNLQALPRRTQPCPAKQCRATISDRSRRARSGLEPECLPVGLTIPKPYRAVPRHTVPGRARPGHALISAFAPCLSGESNPRCNHSGHQTQAIPCPAIPSRATARRAQPRLAP